MGTLVHPQTISPEQAKILQVTGRWHVDDMPLHEKVQSLVYAYSLVPLVTPGNPVFTALIKDPNNAGWERSRAQAALMDWDQGLCTKTVDPATLGLILLTVNRAHEGKLSRIMEYYDRLTWQQAVKGILDAVMALPINVRAHCTCASPSLVMRAIKERMDHVNNRKEKKWNYMCLTLRWTVRFTKYNRVIPKELAQEWAKHRDAFEYCLGQVIADRARMNARYHSYLQDPNMWSCSSFANYRLVKLSVPGVSNKTIARAFDKLMITRAAGAVVDVTDSSVSKWLSLCSTNTKCRIARHVLSTDANSAVRKLFSILEVCRPEEKTVVVAHAIKARMREEVERMSEAMTPDMISVLVNRYSEQLKGILQLLPKPTNKKDR